MTADVVTCEHWFPLLVPHLSELLVDHRALERMRPLARRIPGGLLTALEVRLGPEPSPVDVSVRLAGPVHARHLASSTEPAYLRRFLTSWARDPDPRIPFLWMEFDLDEVAATVPQPIMIARIEGPDREWLHATLLPSLFGAPIAGHRKEAIDRCLDAVPPPGRLVYVFNLECRGTEAVRLDFYGLAPREMASFLDRLERPDLSAALAGPGRLAEGAERFHFNVDVDTEIRPRLGIEASYSNFAKPDSPWVGLFERLVEAGVCTPEKRDAVFAWPGSESARKAPERWPRAGDGSSPEGFLVRSVSHVKLVCQPERAPEAKVYLLFGRYVRGADGKLTPALD